MMKNLKKAAFSAIILLSIILIQRKELHAQSNFIINTIVIADTVSNCSNIPITVNTFLGCTNWTDISQTVSISGTTINVNILRSESIICFGALTYPVYNLNLGQPISGTYTLNVNAVGSVSGVLSTISKTLVIEDCCPNATFNATYDVTDTLVCKGDSFLCTNTSTPVAGVKYKWYVDGNLEDSSTHFSTSFNTTGTHTIRLVADSAGTCNRNELKTFKVIESPTLELGPDRFICAGESTVLDAGLGWDSLMWSTMETTKQIIVSDSGQYSLYARDTSGCAINYDSIKVNLKQAPVVDLGNDTSLCPGASLTLDATYTSSSYLWQGGQFAPAILADTAGKYWVKVTFNPTNCVASDTILIDFDGCIGIGELNDRNPITIGPNPFSDKITFTQLSDIGYTIRMLDILGNEVIKSRNLVKNEVLSTHHLKSGIYFILLEDNGGNQFVEKLVKR